MMGTFLIEQAGLFGIKRIDYPKNRSLLSKPAAVPGKAQ
jgi:hypothetical protein